MNSDAAASNKGSSSEESNSTEAVWVDAQYYDGEAAIFAANFNGQGNVAVLLWTKDLDAQGRTTSWLKTEAEKIRNAYNIESDKLHKRIATVRN
jgi:hypothetical protein